MALNCGYISHAQTNQNLSDAFLTMIPFSFPILSPSKGVMQENIYTACRPPSSMVQPVRPQPRMMDSNPEVSCCVRRGFLLPWSAPNHPKLNQLSIQTHDFWDAPILVKLLISIPLTQDDKIYTNVRIRDRNKRKQTIHLWSTNTLSFVIIVYCFIRAPSGPLDPCLTLNYRMYINPFLCSF